MTAKPEVTKQFRHSDSKREKLKKLVMAAEKEAETELGGPVTRTYKFVNGGDEVIFTWRLSE